MHDRARAGRLKRTGPLAAVTGPRPALTCEPRPAGLWRPPPAGDSDERPPPHSKPARSEPDPGPCLRLWGLRHRPESGSGGEAVEAIADLLSIARSRSWRRLRRSDGFPAAVAPGYQTFWFVRRPGGRRERRSCERYCRTTHTGERTSERTNRTAGSAGDTDLVTAVTASQGRTFRRGVTTPTSQ